MLSAIFNSNPLLLWSLFALPLLAAGPTILLGRRYHRSILLSLGFSTSLAVELVATLYPTALRAPAQMVCTVQSDLIGALLATQGLMNLALYVPLGFFAALLSRRPVAAWAGATLLSATTEITQAITPGMGRSCDSGDLLTNSLGAALGCLLAILCSLLLKRFHPGAPRVHVGLRQLRLSAASLVLGTGVLASASLTGITFVSSSVADDMLPATAQTAAAARAAHIFFGASTSPTHVQFIPGSFGQPGVVDIATPMGNLTLAWPSQEITSGFFSAQVRPTKQAPGLSDTAALADATAYARSHFSWGLVDSFTLVNAGPPGTGSKDVEWRSRVNGVLMPMRLGIIVEANGQIGAFEAKDVMAPPLPHVNVTKAQATAKALAASPGDTIVSSELLAQQASNGSWHVRWLMGLAPIDTKATATTGKVMELDATTNIFITSSTQ